MSSNGDEESPLDSNNEVKNEYYRSIFNKYDRDSNGYLDIKELKILIQKSTEYDDDIPRHVVRRIFSMSDSNHDGRITFEEFVKMINDPRLETLFGRYVKSYLNFVLPPKKRDYPDLQYEDEYTCCPPPFWMILISILEVIFFAVDEIYEKNSTNYGTGITARMFIYDPTIKIQVWRYLTYMFVHIGVLHLTVNLATQLLLGLPLEMVHGYRVLIIYFAGVIAGSLGTSVVDPYTRLAGASGGVYSLITAHIATIIMNWSDMTFPFIQLLIFLIITCVDVGTSIYNRYYLDINQHVGYAAHFAGALAGLLVGITILRNLHVSSRENKIWWFALIAYFLLMAAAILVNIFGTFV